MEIGIERATARGQIDGVRLLVDLSAPFTPAFIVVNQLAAYGHVSKELI